MISSSRIALTLAVIVPGLTEAGASRAAPLCVFESVSFSEGARICAEPGLMMSCTINGERAVWTVVTEPGGICAAPRRGERHAMRRHVTHHTPPDMSDAPPPPDSSAKCFTFNGKRFCE